MDHSDVIEACVTFGLLIIETIGKSNQDLSKENQNIIVWSHKKKHRVK
jgi:hypothetical protein